MSDSSWLFLTFVVLAAIVYKTYFTKAVRLPTPPGPPGQPILGNALQLPTHHEWLAFHEWSKKYGEVLHLSMFGQSLIVLNSAKATTELLEKKSSIYSDRPRLPMVGDILGYSGSIPLCPYGPRHRESRKLLSGTLAQRKAEELHPIQLQKARECLMQNILESPDKLIHHIRHTVAAIVFLVSHGYTVSSDGDPLVELADRATREFGEAAAPGAFLVDLLPIMKYIPEWFPGAGWKRKGLEWRKTTMKLRDEPYEAVRAQMAKGTALPSFTSNLIEKNPNPSPEVDDMLRWITTGFYSAGADTTVSAISSFYLAMTLHPDVLRKAQAEMDAVVGPSRLPNFGDRSRLPYLESVLKEVLRWNPVAPLAIPHRLIEDDVYEGYYMPKGALVFANTWSIMHDEKMYPDAFTFNPERYNAASLDKGLNPDPAQFAFGYGRRVCPGQYLADASLWISIAMSVAVFDIKKKVGPNGQVVEPRVEYTSGTVSHPEPFECDISPRSEAAVALIRGD